MKWKKMGIIYKPKGNLDWMIRQAQLPFADRIRGDLYRIYFAGRNDLNMSQVGCIEVDINEPRRVLHTSPEPVLRLGSLGAFDDCGVFPSWLTDNGDKKYLYYVGWTQGRMIPWFSWIGLAISSDGGKSFEKFSEYPIMDRNYIDKVNAVTSCVIIDKKTWRMWYVSGIRWEIGNNGPKPYYHIKYATSNDGIRWERKGIVCIDFKSEEENAIARPCVIKENGIYRMWYSYSGHKGKKYRIGYAESEDGIEWKRMDEDAGIDVSDSGWDSEMICYPFVFEHEGRKFMLYNGNDFGREGFGCAILEE